MARDKQMELDLNVSLVQAAATYSTTSSYDLLVNGTAVFQANPLIVDVGIGVDELIIRFEITADFTSGGAATLQFVAITGTGVNGSGTINAGQRVLAQTEAIPKATCVKGYYRDVKIPKLAGNTDRYLAAQYIIGTAAGTAGTLTVSIAPSTALQQSLNWATASPL